MKPAGVQKTKVAALFLAAVLVLAIGSAPTRAQSSGDYVLGPGDIVDVSVFGQADLTRTLTVRPDGKISLPLIGEIQATGLTPAQLADKLATALRTYLKDPVVTVTVSQTRVSETQVYLVGEFRNPGSFELRKGWTVMEAIAQAGGVTEKAALKKASLIRRSTGQTIPLDLDRLIKKGDQTANMPVMGGDVILIPEFLNRVIIMGGVRNPAAYDLKEEARLMDALAAAGGPDDKAQLGQVAVTRQTGNARVLVGTVDVNKIIKQGDQSQNILMQHGDVVYIPNNKVRWQDLLSYLGGVSLVRSIFGF